VYPAGNRRFIRYLSITHLANAGRPAAELRTAREALALLLNSLVVASACHAAKGR